MSAPFTTPAAVESLRPNIHVFPPQDLVPDALILRCATKVASIEGDEPVVRAPFIDYGEAGFTPEGAEIDEDEIDSSEITISTGKVTILTCVSREQYRQNGVSELLTAELKRAVISKADVAFLTQPAPPAGRHTPPPGVLVFQKLFGAMTRLLASRAKTARGRTSRPRLMVYR